MKVHGMQLMCFADLHCSAFYFRTHQNTVFH